MLLQPEQSVPIVSRIWVLVALAVIIPSACSLEVAVPVPLPESRATRSCMGIDGPFPIVSTPQNPLSPVSALARQRVVPIRWPPGFTATFTPGLVVKSAEGVIIAKAGEVLPAGEWAGLFVCGTTSEIDVLASQ